MSTPTRGTSRMGKDPVTGRSAKIEIYTDMAVEWIYGRIRRAAEYPDAVIDLGCDTGYMLSHFKDKHHIKNVLGVDMYSNGSLFEGVEILREDIASPVLPQRVWKESGFRLQEADEILLITMSHSLEHVCNPHAVIQNIKEMEPTFVYIAVPHAMSEWANWGSHLTCWTSEFLKHTMVDTHGFKLLALEEKCLNPEGNVEIWGLFEWRNR